MNEEFEKVKSILQEVHRPYFLFDADPDGLCSFLQLYKKFDSEFFTVVKSSPTIDDNFSHVVSYSDCDSIIILDKPSVSDEFLSKFSKIPIIWIDHHDLFEDYKHFNNLYYYNPKMEDPESFNPTSYIVYQMFKANPEFFLVGTISDWFYDDLVDETLKEAGLDSLTDGLTDPGEIIFNSELGNIILFYSFFIKIKSKSLKTYIRRTSGLDIKSFASKKNPYYKKIKRLYDNFMEIRSYEPNVNDENLVYLRYGSNNSYTPEISNFLLSKFPEKTIMVGRETYDSISCSLRSRKIDLSKVMKQIFSRMEGFGGGHKNAAGCSFKKEDEEIFLNYLRSELE